jgi:hypothetical protein
VNLDETSPMKVSFSLLPLADFDANPTGGFYMRDGRTKRDFTAQIGAKCEELHSGY